jgi:hypothetical protein
VPEVPLEFLGAQLALAVTGEHRPDAEIGAQKDATVWPTVLDHIVPGWVAGEAPVRAT